MLMDYDTGALRLLCTVSLMILAPSLADTAVATTIDFDSLPANVTVTNQFPEATFSSIPGFEVGRICFLDGDLVRNSICARPVGGAFDCVTDVIVDFTSPVMDLSFLVAADDAAGTTALVDVYVNFVFASTVNIVTDGDGPGGTTHLIDLSAFTNVTRIVMRDVTDPFGLVYDDFNFNAVFDPAPVPSLSPLGIATLGMGLAGFLGVVAKRTG